jgi:hypothetical protein
MLCYTAASLKTIKFLGYGYDIMAASKLPFHHILITSVLPLETFVINAIQDQRLFFVFSVFHSQAA